jgi:hypothetical protein
LRGIAGVFGLTVEQLRARVNPDTRMVEIPRHVYDDLAARAEAKNMAFGDYLIWRLTPKGGWVKADGPGRSALEQGPEQRRDEMQMHPGR